MITHDEVTAFVNKAKPEKYSVLKKKHLVIIRPNLFTPKFKLSDKNNKFPVLKLDKMMHSTDFKLFFDAILLIFRLLNFRLT